MAKHKNPDTDFRTYAVSSGGIELELIESTKKLVPNDLLASVARYCDDIFETGQPPLLQIQEAKELWLSGELSEAHQLLTSIAKSYPECRSVPQFLLLSGCLEIEQGDRAAMQTCHAALDAMIVGQHGVPELLQLLNFSLATAIHTAPASLAFKARFGELKAKMAHFNLMMPLLPSPLLPELSAGIQETIRNYVLEQSHDAKQKWLDGDLAAARELLAPIESSYPACWALPQFLLPAGGLAIERRDLETMKTVLDAIERLTAGQESVSELLQLLRISLVIGLLKNFRSPDFDYRFHELKAKLRHASLMGPLTVMPLMPQFRSSTGM